QNIVAADYFAKAISNPNQLLVLALLKDELIGVASGHPKRLRRPSVCLETAEADWISDSLKKGEPNHEGSQPKKALLDKFPQHNPDRSPPWRLATRLWL
ncbi:MAG: hypothetical protein ABIP71_14380, partial [Verrucomicrobiota bacterium]